MLASILIIGFSLVLLVYWFRYSCILVLRNNTVEAAKVPAIPDNRFSFSHVQTQLKAGLELDPLHRSLDRDYQLITYLLEHAAGLELDSLEDRLLVVDYKVMQGWYRLTRTAAPRQAREALSEMASVLAVLGQRIGEQAGVRDEA
jgi:hypothetical protein